MSTLKNTIKLEKSDGLNTFYPLVWIEKQKFTRP